MARNISRIINFCEGDLSEKKIEIFRKRLQEDPDLCMDLIDYIRTTQHVKAQIDMEEAESDHAIQETKAIAQELVENYNNEQDQNSDLYNYVGEIIDSSEGDSGLSNEIRDIEKEIKAYGVDDIVNSWVRVWKDQKSVGEDISKKEVSAINADRVVSHHTSRRKIFIIASASAALIALVLVINTLIPKSAETLYRSYYKPMEPGLLGSRNITGQNATSFSKGIEFYENGDYSSALSMFDNAAMADNQNSEIIFFTGLSQMGINDINQAKKSLQLVVNNSGDFNTEARWYLGLCYLSMGEKAEAKAHLEPLARKQGYYQNQAKKILRRLK